MEKLSSVSEVQLGPAYRLRQTELGWEKRCTICEEWWPADREFFYTTGSHRQLHGRCKACYLEERRGH